MTKYVLAVSGGVDSVVLLDVFRRQHAGSELIVAHFDHGIRPDSAADARFVAGLARRYGLAFATRREELGAKASEATARDRRYAFLRAVAARHAARLVTAHHQDDALETVAINLTRGTGWRGLAAMGGTDVLRPLLGQTKQQLIDYALAHRLEWVEDETNQSDAYLRNRLRRRLAGLTAADRDKLAQLRAHQVKLAGQIDEETARQLAGGRQSSRYFFTMIDPVTADELLRQLLLKRTGRPLTRPQRSRLLLAIKAGRPGSMIEAGAGVRVRLSRQNFAVSP